ncbi:MAG: cation:proton antiporter, partial [Janthinobacterium lividum]
MSIAFESEAFSDLMVVLGAAGMVIPAFAALRISPVVGFILVGVMVGPHGLGMLVTQFPALFYVTIAHAETLAPAAEIGVAMLLFALGLELTVDRLRTMRRLVFRLGPAQLALSAAAVALCLVPFHLGASATVALALALALSSTAVGLQLLSASGQMNSRTGRAAFGVFLFQDIAIAPILLLLNAAADASGFGIAIAKGLLTIAAIVVVGQVALRPLFLQAARTRSPELFLAAALVVVIGAAAAAAGGGMSPVIGALIAGVLLARTEYRRQVEAAIAPFQGLLLGVFLIWVGMRLDLGAVAANPLLVLGAVLGLCLIKAAVMALLLRLTGRPGGLSAHVALLLAAPSETSLIVIGAATAAGILAPAVADFALLTTGLSLAIAPLLGLAGAMLERRLGNVSAVDVTPPPAAVPGRTVVIGFGRVGQMVAAMLDVHDRPYLAVDSDPDAVRRYREAGRPVIYGDARRHELLTSLGLDSAAAVVVTIDADASLDLLVGAIRSAHPTLCVVARARDSDHAAHLYSLGVTDAVPETVESSLQLAEAVLVDLGVPMGLVIASIHQKRADLRAAIQAAA